MSGIILATTTPTALSTTSSSVNSSVASLSTSTSTGLSNVDSSISSLSTSTSTAMSSALSGTGVAGRVTFFNGINSVTSNPNFVFLDANNRLGVGTATPTQAIDVNGNIRALNAGTAYQFLIDPLDSVGPKLKLGTTTNASQFFELGAYNSGNNWDNKTRTLKLFNDGSPNALVISATTGYVGLNTPSPISRLANVSAQQTGTNGLGVDPANGISWSAASAYGMVLRNTSTAAGCGMSVQVDATANTNVVIEAASGVVKSQKWAVLGTGDSVFSGNTQLRNTFAQYNQVASFTADTVGDIRTIKVGTGLQVQNCTVANAVKGAGTWVQAKSALTNSARFSSVFTLGKTLTTAVAINSNAWTDLTWLFCGNAQAGATSGVNIRSQFYYDTANNLLRCLNDSNEGFTFISALVLNGSIISGGDGDLFEFALFRPDDSTIFRSRIDSTPNAATLASAELGNMNLFIGDGGNDNFQLPPVGTPVSTVPYPVYPTGNAGGFRIKIRRTAGNAVLTIAAARQEIRLFN
jgi:hypothetical protein